MTPEAIRHKETTASNGTRGKLNFLPLGDELGGQSSATQPTLENRMIELLQAWPQRPKKRKEKKVMSMMDKVTNKREDEGGDDDELE